MKAWVLHGISDMRLCDVPTPVAKESEVIVKVKAAGICSSDIPRVYSTGAYHYPIILGHEFSGITTNGKRVGVFPLLPCKTCESCNTGRYETCLNYSYLGSRQNGAFAEYVVVPEWNLIELPEDVSYEHAALLEPAAVAVHAARQIDFNRVSNAAVIGNGIIGTLVVKWLAVFGITNLELICRNDNSQQSYDVCVEAVGTTDAFRRCVEMTKANGQIVLVGNPNKEFCIDQKLYWQILRKQLTIKGSWNSRFPDDWKWVLDNTVRLKLDNLITHKYPLDEVGNAFEMMHSRSEKHLKVMTVIE